MARRSLRPHLNQIRSWVRQGRTDAWIAHQLEVTVQEIEQFKRQNDLFGEEGPSDGGGGSSSSGGGATADAYPEEIDLRAEDDEAIAAELEAAMEAERAKAEERAAEHTRADGEEVEEQDAPSARRRRGRRGRRSPREAEPLEGTFDHGEEGYGLWLDPAIQDNPVYAEHWAGHRPVQVTVEEDRIVIRRTGTDD